MPRKSSSTWPWLEWVHGRWTYRDKLVSWLTMPNGRDRAAMDDDTHKLFLVIFSMLCKFNNFVTNECKIYGEAHVRCYKVYLKVRHKFLFSP
jgi:hypothetical protein